MHRATSHLLAMMRFRPDMRRKQPPNRAQPLVHTCRQGRRRIRASDRSSSRAGMTHTAPHLCFPQASSRLLGTRGTRRCRQLPGKTRNVRTHISCTLRPPMLVQACDRNSLHARRRELIYSSGSATQLCKPSYRGDTARMPCAPALVLEAHQTFLRSRAGDAVLICMKKVLPVPTDWTRAAVQLPFRWLERSCRNRASKTRHAAREGSQRDFACLSSMTRNLRVPPGPRTFLQVAVQAIFTAHQRR